MKEIILRRTQHVAAITFSAISLCLMALYNGYPMVFNNDSGVYINQAMKGYVGPDRPIIYGLFAVFFSLKTSLWLVIFTQALIVALMVYYAFRYLSTNKGFIPPFLVFILFSLFTGASFEVGWLMPDVFTAVLILCLGLIIFADNLKVRDFIIISVLAVLSLALHNSHFYICLILLVFLLAGFLIRSVKEMYQRSGIRIRRIVFLLSLTIFSNVITAAIHDMYGGGFQGSRGGIIFFMSSLVEMDILQPYLKENCQHKNYRICEFKDSIPRNFLWSPLSPLRQTGGWKKNEKEYLAIEKDILTTPKYLVQVIYKSCWFTIRQFFSYDIVDVVKPNDEVSEVIDTYYNKEYDRYISSRQSMEKISFRLINYIQHGLVILSLIIYVVLIILKKLPSRMLLFLLFIFMVLIINAWVCSTFSGVYPRYQARVIWLLPLTLFLWLSEKRLLSEFHSQKI